MDDARVYSAMQTDEPLKRYVKTILGQVHLLILDPFSNKPTELILTGQPGTDGSYVEVWSPQEERFIQKANKSHFQAGRIKEMEKLVADTPSPNQLTDDEVLQILSSKFMTLKNRLDKFTDVAPVYRLLEEAERQNLGEKTLIHLREKIAELSL